MIYIIFGLLLMLLWYLADKNLRNDFLPYLKWPALLFALYFIGYDVYFNMEFNRIIEIDKDNPNGLLYSHWDESTNSTIETRLYALQGEDRGVVFSYFKAENELNGLFGGLLGQLLLLCLFALFVQTISIIYGRYMNGDSRDGDIPERGVQK